VKKYKDSDEALYYRQRHRVLKSVLYILFVLSISGGIFLTISPVRVLMSTDSTSEIMMKVDEAISELERVSLKILMVQFDRMSVEKYSKAEESLLIIASKSRRVVHSEDSYNYLHYLDKFFIPRIISLNENLIELSITNGAFSDSYISLIGQSFYYKNNDNRNMRKDDISYNLILNNVIDELEFFLTEELNVYKKYINEIKSSISKSRETAYKLFVLPLILFLFSSFILLTFAFLKRYENARIAEFFSQQRSEELEKLVNMRTADLEKQNNELNQTRDYLVEQEKMAALGGLVAGVAHEVNTPLGIGVTAASFISELIRDLKEQPGKELDTESLADASDLILTNLQRASNLIQGFKRVAVDESGEVVRVFDLVRYLSEDLLPSIHHVIKRRGHEIRLEGLDSLVLKKNPGDFAQIVSNLVINASIHGYGSIKSGLIRVTIEEGEKEGRLSVSDKGVGMDKKTQKRMYDPFFTTNRKDGGSGLGLMLVYNLVSQKLKGKLECRTDPGEGTEFLVTFPLD